MATVPLMRRPRPSTAAIVAIPVVLLLALAGAVSGEVQGGMMIIALPVAVACVLVGPLVLTNRPGHLVGRLLTVAAAVAGAAVVAACWSRFVVPAWFGQWMWLPPLPLMFLALLFFPDGRLPSRRWWPAFAAIAAPGAVTTVALAAAAIWHPRDLVTGVPKPPAPPAMVLLWVAAGAFVLCVLGFLATVAALVVRWRRSRGEERRQTAMVVWAGALLLVGFVTLLGSNRAWLIGAAAVPVAITLAILRYRLYDLDRVIHRGAASTGLTALVVAGFLALVALLGRAVPDGASLVAIVVASAVLAPLCQAMWRRVDRLVFGDRDAGRVLSRLADLAGRTVDPGDLLPRVVETIAGSLQVPYVAMEVEVRDRSVIIAEYGRGGDDPVAFPMLSRGEPVGRLLVAPRTTGGHFSERECSLLRGVASQAAAAADSARLVEELRASRERLVMAREEERRRLRRDLHDGIGPTLAGMSLQLLAAHRLLGPGNRAAEVLDALRGDLKTCLAETRQLVDQLRPAALDQGLREGLATVCRSFDSDELRVTLRAAERMDGLPAAVEVAAYRIVAEALTNVARHADARTALVDVRCGDCLEMEIVDDGVGVTATGRRGVGLDSMRERAEELGGECEIGPAGARGTTVRVRLPLAAGTREEAEVVSGAVG